MATIRIDDELKKRSRRNVRRGGNEYFSCGENFFDTIC